MRHFLVEPLSGGGGELGANIKSTYANLNRLKPLRPASDTKRKEGGVRIVEEVDAIISKLELTNDNGLVLEFVQSMFLHSLLKLASVHQY